MQKSTRVEQSNSIDISPTVWWPPNEQDESEEKFPQHLVDALEGVLAPQTSSELDHKVHL